MSCEREPPRPKPRTSLRATPQLPPQLAPRVAPRAPPRAVPRPPPRPPRPAAQQQPSPSDSVFTYSPPESGQEEWQPYYYYPSPNQPVIPGPKFSESDYASTGPASLGLKRNRVSVGADSQQAATGEGCPFPGSATGDYPQPTPSPEYSSRQGQNHDSVASPTPSPGHTKRGSYIQTPSSQTLLKQRLRYPPDTDPQQAHGMGLGEIDRSAPSPSINDRSQAASPKSARTPQVGPMPVQQRRKLSFHYSDTYSPDTTVRTEAAEDSLLADIPPRRRLSVMSPSKLTDTSIYESPPQRRSQLTDTSIYNEPPPPTTIERRLQLMDTSIYKEPPPPTTIQKRSQLMDTSIYKEPRTATTIQRRSQLADTSIYQESPSPKGPQKSTALIDSLKRRLKALKRVIPESSVATQSDVLQGECANQEIYEKASTPVIGRTRFNLKSVPPIQKTDFSTGYFEGQDSPEIYSCPATSRDKTFEFTNDEFNCGFLQEPSRQSENFSHGADRRRSFSTSALQQSSLEARKSSLEARKARQRKPYRVPATVAAGNVEVLTTGTFAGFLQEQDMAIVMFHNDMVNKQGDLQSWAQTSIKLPPDMKQTFASVDCAVEAHLCAKESIATFPFFKVYYKGRLVNAVKDLASLNY